MEVDSSLGFVATDLDMIWTNYRSGPEWLCLETKCFEAEPKFFQQKLLGKLAKACESDRDFRGFHLLQFERTTPQDGKMWLDGKEITEEQLLLFLKFEAPQKWYRSCSLFQ